MSFDIGFYLIDHRLVVLMMLVFLIISGEIGYRRGFRQRKSKESIRSLISGTGAAMLGLLGLLLGFTLSMVISRWDARRDIILTESNAIGTLWLRAGLLEEPLCSDLRSTLRVYTDSRIELGHSRGDHATLNKARDTSDSHHALIWSVVTRANQPTRNNAVLNSLITAANDLFDVHELRLASIENYLPASLFLLLLTVASVSLGFLAWSFGAANQGGRRAILALGLLIGAVMLLIMDINRPQRGKIRIGVESLQRVSEAMAQPHPLHNSLSHQENSENNLRTQLR